MNYNEFISISKESMNDITFEIYSKEIEPCYNWLPEVNSKKEFINWWKKNKDLCRWISNILVQLEEESGEKLELKKRIAELEEDQFRNNRLIATLMGEKEAVMEEKEMVEQDKDKLEEELKYVREVKNKVDDENDKLTTALEKKNEYIDNLMSEALNDRSNLLDKIADLELKIAFTPDAVVREIRWEFFDTYDEKKQDAIKRGIIKA
jgi:chromosome segregation ATPase